MKRGIFYALFAFVFWGFHPIYWKLLKHVPSVEIVSHRVLWSFIFFAVIIFFRAEWSGLIKKIKSSKKKVDSLCSGTPSWIELVNVYLGGQCRGYYRNESRVFYKSPYQYLFRCSIFKGKSP